jgi:hypothetical protein
MFKCGPAQPTRWFPKINCRAAQVGVGTNELETQCKATNQLRHNFVFSTKIANRNYLLEPTKATPAPIPTPTPTPTSPSPGLQDQVLYNLEIITWSGLATMARYGFYHVIDAKSIEECRKFELCQLIGTIYW